MQKNRMPSAYTILILIIIVVAILTWIVPAGQYDYVDPDASKKQPIPGTYHSVEASPQNGWDVIAAPIDGFYDAREVCLFVIVIGGFLGVIMKTGAIDAGIANVVKNLKGREKWMIPILMTLFSIGGTTFGMAEETIAFYPLLLPVFVAAGYDTITAVGVILLGAGTGVLCSTVNPFATGIASGFAGISLGEGMFLRLGMLVICLISSIIYVMRYAESVKKDPSKSIVYDMKEDNLQHFLHQKSDLEFPELTGKRQLVLWLFALTFATMIFGIIPFADMGITVVPTLYWWFREMTTLFFTAAILVGVFFGLKEKEVANAFVSGARDLLAVALTIGVSRGITVVMNNGNITDTILHFGEQTLAGTGSVPFAILTYLFYIPMAFLIPSTSGLATLSMPIMAPMGDFAHVARDIVITAYQSASGLVNLVTPTSAVVMGALGLARVPYDKWLKFVWKQLLVLMAITMVVLTISVLM